MWVRGVSANRGSTKVSEIITFSQFFVEKYIPLISMENGVWREHTFISSVIHHWAVVCKTGVHDTARWGPNQLVYRILSQVVNNLVFDTVIKNCVFLNSSHCWSERPLISVAFTEAFCLDILKYLNRQPFLLAAVSISLKINILFTFGNLIRGLELCCLRDSTGISNLYAKLS